MFFYFSIKNIGILAEICIPLVDSMTTKKMFLDEGLHLFLDIRRNTENVVRDYAGLVKEKL